MPNSPISTSRFSATGAKRRQLGWTPAIIASNQQKLTSQITAYTQYAQQIYQQGYNNIVANIPQTLTIVSDGRSGRMGGRAPVLLERLEGVLMNLVPIVLLIFAFWIT